MSTLKRHIIRHNLIKNTKSSKYKFRLCNNCCCGFVSQFKHFWKFRKIIHYCLVINTFKRHDIYTNLVKTCIRDFIRDQRFTLVLVSDLGANITFANNSFNVVRHTWPIKQFSRSRFTFFDTKVALMN